MDEILSSIRQIIADDDAAAVPRRPPPSPAEPDWKAETAAPDVPAFDPFGEDEPLALSAGQIVGTAPSVAPEPFGLRIPPAANATEDAADTEMRAAFVDPEDIAFEVEPEEPAPPPPQPRQPAAPSPAAMQAPREPRPMPRPRPTAAQAAPMPDPRLSSDIADELIEPATNAAVRANFARLNGLGLGNHGLTIESMMRDMLRPMLKEWLDENLPTVVERMVEKEIARISRGVQ